MYPRLLVLIGVIAFCVLTGKRAEAEAEDKKAAPAAAPAFAATSIPAEDQEQMSRDMLEFQAQQVAYLSAQTAWQQAQARYQQSLLKWQAKYHKEGCSLTMLKEWQCAPVPATAPEKK